MDRLYRSSWTGAHEIFQAREYHAGASQTHQASKQGSGRQLDSASTSFENTLEIVAPLFHEAIHKEVHLYCMVDRKEFISFNAVR